MQHNLTLVQHAAQLDTKSAKSHVTTKQHCKYTTWMDIKKTCYKRPQSLIQDKSTGSLRTALHKIDQRPQHHALVHSVNLVGKLWATDLELLTLDLQVVGTVDGVVLVGQVLFDGHQPFGDGLHLVVQLLAAAQPLLQPLILLLGKGDNFLPAAVQRRHLRLQLLLQVETQANKWAYIKELEQ